MSLLSFLIATSFRTTANICLVAEILLSDTQCCVSFREYADNDGKDMRNDRATARTVTAIWSKKLIIIKRGAERPR